MKGKYNGRHMTIYGTLLPGARTIAWSSSLTDKLTEKAKTGDISGLNFLEILLVLYAALKMFIDLRSLNETIETFLFLTLSIKLLLFENKIVYSE